MKVKVKVHDTDLNSYKVMQHLSDVYGSNNNPESPTGSNKIEGPPESVNNNERVQINTTFQKPMNIN
jgi:hypothetical protein